MPANKGRRPNIPLCDLLLRNGRIIRGVDPKSWRFEPWPWGDSDFDILTYQPARG